MKAETLKEMLYSGKYDNLTIGEFARLVKDADKVVEDAFERAKQDMLNFGSLDRDQEAPIGSNSFMEG